MKDPCGGLLHTGLAVRYANEVAITARDLDILFDNMGVPPVPYVAGGCMHRHTRYTVYMPALLADVCEPAARAQQHLVLCRNACLQG